ncbi:MAG: glutathione S-transferase family protein [Alphaproteobacteria bacterium]|nr:glutathione S-transferase family protein [Alphaproteobacteria bacterium]
MSSVRLHQFVVPWELPNPSPFCLKAETFLKLAGLEYEVVPWTPMGAPLGKAPFIELDGTLIPDSSRIVRTLLDLPEVQLDAPFAPDDIRRLLPVQRMLEEHTYWAIIVLRWLQDEPWAVYREVIGAGVPGLIRRPLTAWLRRGTRKAALAHGLARHPLDEVVLRARQDLDAVAVTLGDRAFLLGDAPCSVDAGVYAFLECLAHPLGTEALQPAFASGTPLRGYLERMRARAWPDWDFPS